MILWIIILVILVVAIIFVATYALPSIFLRLRCKVKQSQDRCIKRVYEVHGQSLVFEPDPKYRKYVKQYILSERSGRKVAVCKLAKNINYIEYDLIVFDAWKQVAKVIRVKDNANGTGFTKEVELPPETSYLSVNVVRIENQLFDDKMTGRLPKGNLAKFLWTNVAIVLLEVISLKICLANILGDVYRESVILDVNGLLTSGVLALALIIVNTLITVVTIKARERRFTVKEKEDA